MSVPIFLSYPKPCFGNQVQFINRMIDYLRTRGLDPRTLGVTDYDMAAPLKAIRRLMMESNGLITVAFRRTYVEKGTARFRTDIDEIKPVSIDDKWLTTPWAHIEPAMAYQIGLPILILRERGVIDDGILEKGIVGLYMPEFDVDTDLDAYFQSPQWNGVIWQGENFVRTVVDRKGSPPVLY